MKTKKIVWVVDDDVSIGWVLEKALTRGGYEVSVFRGVKPLLLALKSSRPQVVISDIQMPGVDGLKLLELLHENFPTIPVIIMTAYSDFETTSKQLHIPYTSSDKTLIDKALGLFDKLYTRRILIRLIGIRLSKLAHGNYQINLFDDTQEEISLFKATDTIKNKYGAGALMRASTLDTGSKLRYDFNAFSG